MAYEGSDGRVCRHEGLFGICKSIELHTEWGGIQLRESFWKGTHTTGSSAAQYT